ncbi:amidohydrolase [Leifsonia shinshuensis]|uniref:amidohydrolase n=1 Tax=Leifsonia shinshuensis TaxID=150026 RepID=UPI001F51300A|nr:amidohydrolase [Leifsonia shinshuensis]
MAAPLADLIVTGRLYTVDREHPHAEAMAVRDGRILAVGTAADVAVHRGPDTRTLDLGDAFAMPGLIDVHNHHAHAGRAELFELTFPNTASLDGILEAVRAYAATRSPEAWIIGTSWGTGLLDQLAHNTARRALDDAAGGRPVLLTDDSHHNRWASSRALQIAGIDASTPDPEHGVIVRDPHTGEPSGVLLEAAGLLVEKVAAPAVALTAEQQRRASARAIEILHSYGITAFQDAATSLDQMRALAALDARGELRAWVVSSMTVNDQIFGYAELGDELIAHRAELTTFHHRPDFVKIFLDGTPPAHSGAFLSPYLPADGFGDHFHGSTTMPADELLGWLRATAAQGISAKIHCTGDAAVRMVLDAVEAVRADGHTAPRYQIAHGQFIAPDDLPRFAQLGVAADISPFLWFPGVIADALGTVRPAAEVDGLQPNRSLIDSGALVAGGSDWPVSETPNAWEGIQGLVTRADPSGLRPGVLGPEQAITLPEAIEVFTLNGARAMGLGAVTGSLEPGKSADFVVLDRDPFSVPVTELVTLRAQATFFAGEKVYSRA